MTDINITILNCSGESFIITISNESYVNQIYNKLYKFYFHCIFVLLYNEIKIYPFEKISDISTSTNMILSIVLYLNCKCTLVNNYDINSYIAVNTNGKIIDWQPKYYYNSYLDNIKYLKNYLNSNYNCLTIISICYNNNFTAILFEDGIAIILSSIKAIPINTFYNVIKIVKTTGAIGLIIKNLQNYNKP